MRQFFKINEDECFVELEYREMVGDFQYVEPISDNGYWLQKSTLKRYYHGIHIEIGEDGSANKNDYVWIEY